MRSYLLGTDSERTSAALCAYLDERIEPGERVYAVNSLRGGDETDAEDVRAGESALDVVEDRLDATVDPHQLVRGNDPAADLLAFADEKDVDELVIGVHERNPTGKVIFGSTAQEVLLRTSRPVAVVPLE